MTDEFVKGEIVFHNPEYFNDIFAVLKKACAKGRLGIKASQSGIVQFTADMYEYILEATIQADAYQGLHQEALKTFTVERNLEVFTERGEEIFKFIGKLKKGDTLTIQHIDPNNPNFEDTLMIKVNKFEDEFPICKGYTVDDFLAKDLLRDRYAETTITHFTDPYESREKFGKHLKKIKSLLDKNDVREFLKSVCIRCNEDFPEPRLLITDGKYAASIPAPYMEKVPTEIVLNYKAADLLGNLLTHKMMKPRYAHLRPNIQGFNGFMRFGEMEYSVEHPSAPFGFVMREIDCRKGKDDHIESTAVFSFTAAEPLLIHFRFMARHTDVMYPEMKGFFEINDEEAAVATTIHVEDIYKVLDERLDEHSAVKIEVDEHVIRMETKAAKVEIEGDFKAWPHPFFFNNRLFRKALLAMDLAKPHGDLSDFVFVTLRERTIYMATYWGDEINGLPSELPDSIVVEAMPVIMPKEQ